MKRRILIRHIPVLVLFVGGPILWFVARPYRHLAVCRRRLEQIVKASVMCAGDFNEVYPDSLRRLVDFGISPSLLTCPAVKTPPGAVQDIDAWSGYRLVAGIRTDSHPLPVFIYCPPENHNGRCGHIAFTDTHLETFESDEFDTFLAGRGIVHMPKEP